MTLHYLLFDYSEGDDGAGLFDALADVPLARADAVQAEVDAVLAWATAHFGPVRGPIEEGGEWDADLQVHDTQEAHGRRVFSLGIVGSPAFCEAFHQRFGGSVN